MRFAGTAAFSIFTAAAALAQQPFTQSITVERVVVDVHVTDDFGEPIRDLTAPDFEVLVDGERAEVEAVDWLSAIATPEIYEQALEAVDRGLDPILPEGRLIVMFFQTDFTRHRAPGQMRMIEQAIDFLPELLPEDRVAVVSFDSHLKLRTDFTNDHRELEEAIRGSLKVDYPARPKLVHSPAMVPRISDEDARDAASPEKALYLVANALVNIPGPKTLLLFGWGLGRFGSSGVQMIPDFLPASRALAAARTAIFSLDTSDADYHSLEEGLKVASAATGGFYMKTHQFPRLAMKRLVRTISGHYAVVVKKPTGSRGAHSLEVRMPRHPKATVLHRSGYRDGESAPPPG